MRRLPCLALAALLMIVAMPPAMAATAPDGMVRLEQFLERAQSMRAEFRQEVRNGEQQVVDRAEGRVVLKRPGRFRWDYERPYERVVVADGKRLWLYEADLSQVTVRPLTDALGETPAALLTGDRRILERFERVSSWAGDQLAWVRLRPRAADADFSSVAVAFAGDRPAELVLDDRLGQQTHLYFTDVRLNVPVADDSFAFKVPPGVDVIREGEL
ncbi:MAG: outer membrane lipoprotein chaperone LolA [Gammaproteobacteria bacterium]